MTKPSQHNSKRKEVAKFRPRDGLGRFEKKTNLINVEQAFIPDPDFSHVRTFRGIPNLPANLYRTFDEATWQNPTNARAMRNDTFVMESILAREMWIAELETNFEAEDESDPFQVEITEKVKKIMLSIPRFTEFKRNLMEAIWFGRQAIVCEWQRWGGAIQVAGWTPIEGDKLVFGIDGKAIGYFIGQPFDGPDIVISSQGRVQLFKEEDLDSVLIHKHFIVDADYNDWQLAGGINGVGIRAFIYWVWLWRQELMGYMFNSLQRSGFGGIQIWTFELGNPASEAAVRQAAQAQTQNNIILVPRTPGEEKDTTGLNLVEPKGHGLDAFRWLIDDYFNASIKRLILGQTLSSETGSTGMGSGVADFEAQSLRRIMSYDADNLSETLTGFANTIKRLNFPGLEFEIKVKIAVERDNPAEFLESVSRAYEMGMKIDENQLRSVLGLKDPKPGAPFLQKQASDMHLNNELNNMLPPDPENVQRVKINTEEDNVEDNVEETIGE